jgi:PKHD-type hydroxylase
MVLAAHFTDAFASFPNVFTAKEVANIIAHGEALGTAQAGFMLGTPINNINNKIRITQHAWIEWTPETEWLYMRIEQAARAFNERIYQFDITGFSEPFQYTVYHGNEGGHYDWHVDQGRGLPVERKLSFSVQLSEPSDYEGGELQIRAANNISVPPKALGTVIVIPSYNLHRVTPATAGTRRSLVCWANGPRFR